MTRLISAVRVVLVLLCTLVTFRQVNGQSLATDQLESTDSVKLQWKFAEGQTTYYTHEEDRTEKQILAGKEYESVDRLLYRYRWDVVFEANLI